MMHEHPGGGPMMMMGHPGPSMHEAHERHHPRGPMAPGERAAMRELGMLGVHFYPPPMLIQLAGEIGLTPDQVAKIRQEVLGAQTRAVDLRTKMEKAKVESIRLLAADKVDERAVGAQIDEAAKAGAELRKLQVGVMLRVRDLLTPEQRKKLDERKPPRPDVQPGAQPGKQAMDDDDDDDDDDGDEG